MVNIDVYNLRDIQLFLSLLNQFEGEGVTDIRFVRERLSRRMTEQVMNYGKVVRKSKRLRPKPIKCPSCERGLLVGPYRLDGLVLMRCSKKCGYSRVIT